MHAHDRFLPEWFNRIRSRQITLPRFQRFVAWGARRGFGAPGHRIEGASFWSCTYFRGGDEEKFRSAL